MDQQVFLSERVHIEPVVNDWYAVPFLLSPATAAMVVSNHQMPIMQSYVQSPELHSQAVKSAALRGGPFLDYDGDVADIRGMIDRFVADLEPALALATDIKAVAGRLAEQFQGEPLAPIYADLPDSLRGRVELVYDTEHRASMRLIEPLMYRSTAFTCHRRGVVLSRRDGDGRRFLLSSPRLCGKGDIRLDLDWADERLRRLYAMRDRPVALGEALALLLSAGLAAEQVDLAKSLFTPVAPRRSAERQHRGEGVRVRAFGHACLLVQTAELSILTDPLISYDVDGISRFSYNDLPDRIDYVVITHGHQDHLILEFLLQIRHRVGAIIVPRSQRGMLQDPSLRLMLEHAGFDNVIELAELGSVSVPGGEIVGIPFMGEHGDLDVAAKFAYLFRLGCTTIACAADANNIEPSFFEQIRALTGPIDVLFLGMECEGAPMSWLYGPLLTRPLNRKLDMQRRLDGSNADRAMSLLDIFDVRALYIYAMGAEPWMSHISSIQYTERSLPIVESDKLIALSQARNIPSRRLFGREELLFRAGVPLTRELQLDHASCGQPQAV
jgi:L-ascorbate metabolism protein UlaG (beta-lactamase superfamily)